MEAHIRHASVTESTGESMKITVEVTAKKDGETGGSVETLRGKAFLGFILTEGGHPSAFMQGRMSDSLELLSLTPEMIKTVFDIAEKNIEDIKKSKGHCKGCLHG